MRETYISTGTSLRLAAARVSIGDISLQLEVRTICGGAPISSRGGLNYISYATACNGSQLSSIKEEI